MNILIKCIAIVLVLGIIAMAAYMTLELDTRSMSKAASKIVEPTYDIGTKVINSRFTPPGSYELLYRTTFKNGLSIDKWEVVTPDKYKDYLSAETEDQI